MQRYTIFFIAVNALHVSGGFCAHHRELKTVHTAKWEVGAYSWTTQLIRRKDVLFYYEKTTCFGLHWPSSGSLPIKGVYTGCHRRNGPNFGRVFLTLNYTDITQNTYIQSWTVTEIMAREVWNFDSCYTLTDCQIHIETGRNMWFL